MERLIVLVGPSGSGKTTIAEKLVSDYGFTRFKSVTTRQPRDNDPKDKLYYDFISLDEFNRREEHDEFIEVVCPYGLDKYGTAKKDLYNILASNERYVFIATYEGYKAIYSELLSLGENPLKICSIYVYIDPSLLEERISNRKLNEKELKARLDKYKEELGVLQKCDFSIANVNLDKAAYTTACLWKTAYIV